jgi:hypothetical protein
LVKLEAVADALDLLDQQVHGWTRINTLLFPPGCSRWDLSIHMGRFGALDPPCGPA